MKRDILRLLEDNMQGFSKGQKLIARFILKEYDKAAYMTASKLGQAVGVSESTVVRFVIELGYEGYPEFQKSLQELIRTKLTSFQRIEVTNNLIGKGDVLSKVLESDAEKIRKTLDGIDHEAFDAAVSHIVGAENIYILGVRSSSSLASFLDHSLRMIFGNVRFVQTSSGAEVFEQMFNINEKDTLIAISFPRYSKRIIKATEYAHKQGADIICLTDSVESPLAASADQLLVAQSDMASFVDSLVAPLSVINALVVAVSRACQDQVTERLRQLEVIWDEYDIYDKTQQ